MDSTVTTLPAIGEYRALKPPVDHRFFDAVGVRVVAGRSFSASEVAAGASVGVVSERFARDFWPGRSPLGQNPNEVRDDMPNVEVIGVVEDVAWDVATPGHFDAGAVFLPLGNDDRRVLLLRTIDAAATMRTVRDSLGSLDTDRRVSVVRISDRLAGGLQVYATLVAVAGVIGLLALTLAFIGLFGVASFMVALRRREIGIRVAIGASAIDVVTLLFGDGMRPVIVGLVVGLGLAMAASRVFAEFLTGAWARATR
jgi:putative ABC transport system permease protein